MKKLLLPLLVLGFILFISNPIQSSAAYDESSDITLSVNLAEGLIEPGGEIGEFTFEVQEGLHTVVTSLTGVELDHSYIWVEVNGVKVLAVDPIKPVFN